MADQQKDQHKQPIKKPISPERFLKYHSQWCQEVANQTGQATDLYRDEDGMPRATLEGWPQVGVKVATFRPQSRRRDERKTPAADVPVATAATEAV